MGRHTQFACAGRASRRCRSTRVRGCRPRAPIALASAHHGDDRPSPAGDQCTAWLWSTKVLLSDETMVPIHVARRIASLTERTQPRSRSHTHPWHLRCCTDTPVSIHRAIRQQHSPTHATFDIRDSMRHPVYKTKERTGRQRRVDYFEGLAGDRVNLAGHPVLAHPGVRRPSRPKLQQSGTTRSILSVPAKKD